MISLIPKLPISKGHLDGGGPVKALTLPPPTSETPSVEEHLPPQGEEKGEK
jgi:hypothetical protein